MAESLSSGVDELNLNEGNGGERYCEEQTVKCRMMSRFMAFGCDRLQKMKKLKEHVLAAADSKTNTTLYKEAETRIAKYYDEDLYFYIPFDDEIGMDMLKNEQSLCALIDTMRWLFSRDEKAELALLLYRNSNFVTLYFAMHEARCLEVLFYLMDIDPDQYNLAEIANGIDWDVWLKSYPPYLKPFLENATSVGFGISCTNKEDYKKLREHLAAFYELNIDIIGQNPWHLGKLFASEG